MLTEWWYYTGHMFTPDGTRYGFEFVVFLANRAGFPSAYVAHFAITDGSRNTFVYDQRVALAPPGSTAAGFALVVDDWAMGGRDGSDYLRASMRDYAIDLQLQAQKPPVLHGGSGYLSLGELGGSYYYSRTRMELRGMFTVSGQQVEVSGEAWMDHQWGNFIPVGEGGWDWFSLQLNDGSDVMVYFIRDSSQNVVASYGTVIDPQGVPTELDADDFTLTATGTWTSPHSGITYPLGWTLDIPSRGWRLALTPTMEDQELDTRATTGVIYWEGEITIAGMSGRDPIGGYGYVELTGYPAP